MSSRNQPPDARTVLAQNLRRMRTERGFSQEALADLAGLHRTYVSQVENKHRNVSIDSIDNLSKALKVPLSEFFKAL